MIPVRGARVIQFNKISTELWRCSEIIKEASMFNWVLS